MSLMNRHCLNAKLLPIFLLFKVKVMPWPKKSVQSFSPSVVCLPCSHVCFLRSCEAGGSPPLGFSGSLCTLQRGSWESGWLSALLPLECEFFGTLLLWRSNASSCLEYSSAPGSWGAAPAAFRLRRSQNQLGSRR